MKPQTMSHKTLMEIMAKHGIQMLPPDHPIYSEGPTITFITRKPKQSDQKGIVSLPPKEVSDED